MNPQEEAERIALDNAHQEARIRSAYDTLFGYLQSVPDVYARAHLVRDLDVLYETSLNTIPDSPKLSAETADIQSGQSAARTGSVSTASSHSPSEDTTG